MAEYEVRTLTGTAEFDDYPNQIITSGLDCKNLIDVLSGRVLCDVCKSTVESDDDGTINHPAKIHIKDLWDTEDCTRLFVMLQCGNCNHVGAVDISPNPLTSYTYF